MAPPPIPAASAGPSAPSFSIAVAPPSPPRSRGDGDDEDAPSDLNIAVLRDPIPLGDMAPPPSTTTKPAFGLQTGGQHVEGDNAPKAKPKLESKAKKRGKVALGPGYSPLDWARLTGSGANLRGFVGPMRRVDADELKRVRSGLSHSDLLRSSTHGVSIKC
jgi:hypothetical protein